MERLTSAGRRSRGTLIAAVVTVLILASGPDLVARLTGFVTSLVTAPVTGEVVLEANRFEVRNVEMMLIYLVAALGLNLLFQTGVISIGQSASVLVGAYTMAFCTVDFELPFWLSLIVSMVVAGIVGLVLGLPGLRLGTFTFVMVTIGYVYVAVDMVLHFRKQTGGGDGFANIPKPGRFDTLESYYWVIVIAAVLTFVVIRNILKSPMGREGKAVESNTVAAASLGIREYMPKLRAFVLASALGGLAGALYAPLMTFVAPEAFAINLSILFVLMVLLGGRGTLLGPLIGVVIVYRIPLAVEEVTDQPGDVSLFVYGAVLLLSVHFVPRGLMSGYWALRDRIRARRTPEEEPTPVEAAEVHERVAELLADWPRNEAGLVVAGAKKHLGGVKAVDGVDLAVEPGQVHALIGPNGSGKTTFLNVISGYLQADEGSVRLAGRELIGTRPEQRARAGLGRTFQTPSVFDGMSCLENVMTAIDIRRRASLPEFVIRTGRARRHEREAYDEAVAILTAVGLERHVERDVAQLTSGERRFLELARVIALRPQVVLLDEPAAGLRSGEIELLEAALRAIRGAGVGILLVEHHVDFVMRIADVATVIDFGQVIAHGDPRAVRQEPEVIEAYFGSAEPPSHQGEVHA